MHIHGLIHPALRLADQVAVEDDRRPAIVESAARPDNLRSLCLRDGVLELAVVSLEH